MLCWILMIGEALAAPQSHAVVEARLRELAEAHGELVLVAAAGPDAERAVQDMMPRMPSGSVELVRVPTVGDPAREAELKLGASPATCLAWVSTFGPELRLSTFGDCPALSDAPPPPPPPTAPVAAGRPQATPTPEVPASFKPSPEYVRAQRELLALEASLPDPTTAFLLSGVIGFGVGHFYAGDNQRGAIHLSAQLGGLALTGLATLAAGQNADAALALQVLGGGVLGISRLVDMGTAPLTAHEQAEAKALRGR